MINLFAIGLEWCLILITFSVCFEAALLAARGGARAQGVLAHPQNPQFSAPV